MKKHSSTSNGSGMPSENVINDIADDFINMAIELARKANTSARLNSLTLESATLAIAIQITNSVHQRAMAHIFKKATEIAEAIRIRNSAKPKNEKKPQDRTSRLAEERKNRKRKLAEIKEQEESESEQELVVDEEEGSEEEKEPVKKRAKPKKVNLFARPMKTPQELIDLSTEPPKLVFRTNFEETDDEEEKKKTKEITKPKTPEMEPPFQSPEKPPFPRPIQLLSYCPCGRCISWGRVLCESCEQIKKNF